MVKWHYSHDGAIFGPFTVTEMRDRAAQGLIAPTDTIWKEGSAPEKGVAASRALDCRAFSSPPVPQTALNLGVDPVLFGGAAPAAKPPTRKAAKEKDAAVVNQEAPETAAAPLPVEIVQVAMVAIQLPEAIPVDPPQSQAVEAAEMPAADLPVEEEPPPAIPVDDSAILSAAVAAVHAEGISLSERYRRACSALSQWADKDENVPLILSEDVAAMCMHPEVLEILRAFQSQPFEIMERLMEHLDSMVQNRASYYRALAQRGKARD